MPSTLPFLLHVSQEPFEAEKALAVASLVNSYGAQLLKQLSLNNVYEGFDNDPLKELAVLEMITRAHIMMGFIVCTGSCSRHCHCGRVPCRWT